MGIEWPLVLFTVVAGSGAAMLAFAGIGEFFGASKKARFITPIIALVLLVIGGCLSLLHLGNPINFMAAATNLFSFSPISLELIFLGICVIVAIIYLVLVNRESSASKIVGVVGIIAGVLFCYFSGHGYEVIGIRPGWATPAMTLSYCFSALTLGGFLFLTLQVVFKDDEASVKKTAMIVSAAAVLMTIAFIAYGATAPLGDASMILWVGGVVVGGVISIAAGALVYLKNTQAMVYVGALTALVGVISVRAVMWLAGALMLPGFFDLALSSRSMIPF